MRRCCGWPNGTTQCGGDPADPRPGPPATYSPFLPIHPETGVVMQVPMEEVRPADDLLVWTDPDDRQAARHADHRRPLQGAVEGRLGAALECARRRLRDVGQGPDRQREAVRRRSAASSAEPRRPASPMSCSSTSRARRSASRRATASPSRNGCAMRRRKSLSHFMYQPAAAGQAAVLRRHPARGRRIPRQPGKAHRPQPDPANPAWHIHNGSSNDPGSPIAFAMLLNLASVVNAEGPEMLWGFIGRYDPDVDAESSPMLARLVEYAVAYFRDFVAPTEAAPGAERAGTRRAGGPAAGAPQPARPTATPRRSRLPLRGRQAAPLRQPARLVRLPVPGAARRSRKARASAASSRCTASPAPSG